MIPVDYNGTTCSLPAWSDTSPSLAMRISAVLGTLILVVWTVRAFTRPETSGRRAGGTRKPAGPKTR